MTISFQTHWPKSMGSEYAGEPNHFVPKIWTGLMNYGVLMNAGEWGKIGLELPEEDQNKIFKVKPKIHTFREDPNDRWKVGMKIHPVINNRTKDRLQFAPVLEVKSIQKIEIIYDEELCEWHGVEPVIKIDDREIRHYEGEYAKLAVNDGFESIHQFVSWFNKDFTGKIIHWTDLKY